MAIEFQDKSRDIDPDDGWSAPGVESYVAVVGDISTGHRVVGPFEQYEVAEAWLKENISPQERTWIMNLLDPESADGLKR